MKDNVLGIALALENNFLPTLRNHGSKHIGRKYLWHQVYQSVSNSNRSYRATSKMAFGLKEDRKCREKSEYIGLVLSSSSIPLTVLTVLRRCIYQGVHNCGTHYRRRGQIPNEGLHG